MTKPTVVYPDVERAALDLVRDLITPHVDDATFSIGVPGGRKAGAPKHFQVAWDGTPIVQHPIVAHGTIRVVAWSALDQQGRSSPTQAKDLALLAQGLLLSHDGTGLIRRVGHLVGVLPDRDPDTDKDIAWFTVRCSVRSQPI